MRISQFLSELKQRHMYRVALIYAAAAWFVLQVAELVLDSFAAPGWSMQALIVITVAGFPAALLMAWVFDGESEQDQTPADPLKSAEPAMPAEPLLKDTLASRPAIVVLPFACSSDNAADRWEANAITEDLTTLIARMPGYFVVARNTAYTFRDRNVDVRDIGRELGVRYVLEGTLRHPGDRVRVTVQLIETDNGTHLWAEKFDHPEGDIEALHDELCRTISLKLGSELTRAEAKLAHRKAPTDWDAWERYQQAKGLLQFSGWNRESFERTAALLREAIAEEPDFAPAHAYLALILALGHWIYLVEDREMTYRESVEAAEKALKLSPDSSEVLGYVGCAWSDLGERQRGIPIIARAVDLDPSNAQAFAALGTAKVLSGNLDEGIEDLEYALQLSPADPGLAPWATVLSTALAAQGKLDRAVAWAEAARDADPRFFLAYLSLASIYTALGRSDDARRAADETRLLFPELSRDYVSAVMGGGTAHTLINAGLL